MKPGSWALTALLFFGILVLWVPERWAMMDDFTFLTIASWHPPHVSVATRRSLGFGNIPTWARLTSVAVASPR